MLDHDDQALIQRAQRGELEAFNGLVLRYQDAIFTVAYRLLGDEAQAADAAQDAFLQAYRKLSSFAGGNFRAWLGRIAHNHCIDLLRRAKRRPATSLEALTGDYDDAPIASALPSPEQALQRRELNAAIQRCILALPDEQRAVLVLCDVDGLAYQDIATTTGAQLGTVKSRLARARLAMRRCLQAVQELLPAEFRQIDNAD